MTTPALLAVVLLAAGASASPVPESVTTGWDASRKDANTTWVEYPFRDEWGTKKSVWALRAQAYPICSAGQDCDKVFYGNRVPTFYLQDVPPPAESRGDSGVSYKKAVLSRYELTSEKVTGGGNTYLVVSGTTLKLEPDSPYSYNGVDYPAKPVGAWVVVAPSSKEDPSSSPMREVGSWPRCMHSPDSTVDGRKVAAVFNKLHPVEVELAHFHADYGPWFTSSAAFKKALSDDAAGVHETAYTYAQTLRGKVFSEAKTHGDTDPSSESADRFAAYEAKLLACRLHSASLFSADKVWKDMGAAKDPKPFVRSWRDFLHAELKRYAGEAKDLPGAKATETPWQGLDKLDYKALRSALETRTLEAIRNGGAPAPASSAGAAPRRRVPASTGRRVTETAGSWAEDLIK